MSYIQSNAVIYVDEAYTVTPADSGKIILIDKTSGAFIVSLPAPQQGLSYKFVNYDTVANICTIQALVTTTPITGNTINGPIAGATIAITSPAGNRNVNFGTTCEPGDNITLFSDGEFWFVQGISGSNAAATGITFT